MQDRRRILKAMSAIAATSALGALASRPTWAQPLELIKIMYGFPPGSAGDTVARRVGENIAGTSYSKGQGIVENRPGAGGRIAVEALKNSPPDGSVLTLAPVSALAVYPYIYPKLSYRPEDVTQVSIGALMYHGLAIGPAVPDEIETLDQFLAWAKANPERATYGTPGAGSMPHLLGALLGIRSGVALRHVPYRGTAPSVTELVGGQIAATMNPSGDYIQYMKNGRVRVLGTSGKARSPYLPDVPTFTELGYPDVTSEEWFGFYAPAKTPAATIAAANQAINAALKKPAVIESLGVVGLVAHGSTPEAMAADQHAEYDRWGPLVKQIGFTAES